MATKPRVLLVTGPPASGKTTVGRQLAARLDLPYLSKDFFKESLFDSLGYDDREWSRRVGLASMRLLFQTAERLLEAGQSVALEANFYPQWDTLPLRNLHDRFGCQFVQVVCTAETATLLARFTARARSGKRHPGHVDLDSMDEMLQRIASERWDALALPGPVLTVDTTSGPVDLDDLLARIVVV